MRVHLPAGPRADLRTCLGCRRRDDVARLLRVVADASGVTVDPRRRAPGRGAYVHPDAGCVAQAVRRRAFGRALRAPVDAAAAGGALTAYLAGADAGGGGAPAQEAEPGPFGTSGSTG